ncbi:MAG TPA: BadF/BadG/BcrA/BcrD ATPase family protein, partial [Chthonomonadales bacterium]|nr:BadF/BadG/BcrA/BcrD ATPase family protein [Chthonomonadales bacterium]
NKEGAEVGRGHGGPGNAVTVPAAQRLDSIRKAIAGALTSAGAQGTEVPISGACAAIAGYSAPDLRAEYMDLLRNSIETANYRVEPDYVAAYWGASRGAAAIVVIAGTGAVAFGCNAAGECCREDGLGYLLGDRGSGFNLGIRMLRHAIARISAGSRDRLTEAVTDYTGCRSENELIQWLYRDFTPARVAALAPLAGALAEAGDPSACAHVARMAQRLRNAVRAIRNRLWLGTDTPIYPLGGLWQLGEFFRAEFAEPHWREETGEPMAGPLDGRLNVCVPLADGAVGAALLAMQTAEEGA